MKPTDINTNTYTLTFSGTTASQTITVSETDKYLPTIVVQNDTNKTIFVKTFDASTAAVFPTPTTSQGGKTVAANSTVSFTKIIGDKFVSIIPESSATGKVYVSLGTGV